ncbi:MAG TPA: hypothetical protein DCL44_06900 [Elusimicrobia bacterium]|nr:hypothetical protein [Elusimicrobiota bacterium]
MGGLRTMDSSLFLKLLFSALLIVPSVVFSSPETERQAAASLFDGSDAAYTVDLQRVYGKRDSNTQFLLQVKEIMSSGAWDGPMPQARQFMFRNDKEGWSAQAQSVGLEGFLWTKKELEGKYGAGPFLHHMNDYFVFLNDLLKDVSWTTDLRDSLNNLKVSPMSPVEKNARLNAILENYVSGLQANIAKYDAAAWAKKARIYELFPRAYNLAGRRSAQGFKSPADPSKTLFFRDFKASDFDVIKRMGFNAVWPMGILPIGVRGQTGAGGGSPYSISDHSAVNPDLGAEDDFKKFVTLAHQAGLKVIVDFVVNHTSLDSKLLAESPDYFVSFRYDGACPRDGYFDYYWQGARYCVHHGGFEYGGGVSSWIDTAQVNYSNQALRDRMTTIVKSWVTKFDVDGFRVDMAYLALNNVFSRTWQKSMPHDEFYRQLIWTVKAAKPSAAFMAEAYAYQEDLSATGFDTIYSKYEVSRPEGQTGWYDATSGGNGPAEAGAINRAAFLAWQRGGAGSVVFLGNHDEPAPETVYGRRLPAALMLTMLYPGSVMAYSGAEIGYNSAIPTESKPLPFSAPCQINWSAGDSGVKQTYQTVFSAAEAVREQLGDYDIQPLWPPRGQNWVGYVLKSKTVPGLKKAVIGNITWDYTAADIPGFNFSSGLQSGEYRIIDLLK